MSQTALFIERDASYVNVTRKLRGTMTREEWNQTGHRQAALIAAWKAALADIKQWDSTAEFISPLTVTLYISRLTGAVIVADISHDAVRPIWITQQGINLLLPPVLTSTLIRRTTYAHWAEGPLPHVEFGMLDAPTPDSDPEIQRLRAQNSSIRDALDSVMRPANWAQMPRAYTAASSNDLIDFRVRGVFRVKDFSPLDSKQATAAKLRTSEGVLDLGEDGIAV